MFCYNCGKEIRDDANFCTYCGAKIVREINEQNQDVDSSDIVDNQNENIVPATNVQENFDICGTNQIAKKSKSNLSNVRKIIFNAALLAIMLVCLCMVFAPIFKVEWSYESSTMSFDEDLKFDSIKVLTLYFDSFVDNTEAEQKQDDVYKEFLELSEELNKYILRGDEESAEEIFVLCEYMSIRLNMRSKNFSASIAQHVGAISLMIYILVSLVGVIVALIGLIGAINKKNIDKTNKIGLSIAKILFILGLSIIINKGACGIFVYNLQASYGLLVPIIMIAGFGIAKFITSVVADKKTVSRKTLIFKIITALLIIVAIGCMSGSFVSFTYKCIARDATMNTGFGIFNYFDSGMVEYYEANHYPMTPEQMIDEISTMYTRREIQEGDAFGMNNFLMYGILYDYSVMNYLQWFSLISIASIVTTMLLGAVLICSIFSLGDNKKSIFVIIAKSISTIFAFVVLAATIAFVLLMQYFIADIGIRADYSIAVGGAIIAAIFFIIPAAFLPYHTKEKNMEL
ncbi:MAG: zinc-ribbon domain-containing protein [Christensenellales bacterium]